jgi:hypothetical protein
VRQPTAALGVAVICVLVAGCGSTKGLAGSTTTTRSMIPRPLVERELAELLLSPDRVNVAMGATAMTVTNAQTSMSDNSATMARRPVANVAAEIGVGEQLLGRWVRLARDAADGVLPGCLMPMNARSCSVCAGRIPNYVWTVSF